jgi:hypothetical protein
MHRDYCEIAAAFAANERAKISGVESDYLDSPDDFDPHIFDALKYGRNFAEHGFYGKEYKLMSLPITIGEDEETSVEEDCGKKNCTMQHQMEDPKLVGGLDEGDGMAGENCKGDEWEL